MLSLFDNLSIDGASTLTLASPSFPFGGVTSGIVQTRASSASTNCSSYIICIIATQSLSSSTLILPCPPLPPRSPSTNPRVHSSLPPPVFLVPKTPRHRPVPTTVVGLTLFARGSSIRRKQEGDIEPELKNQIEPALQVCRYLRERLSVPLLRSHATVSLVDRNRLQPYHANRSVILVSSAIKFSKGDGKDKFIGTIIGFYYLSLE